MKKDTTMEIKTPIGAKLIGGFSREGAKGKLTPAIDIVTVKGVVTVRVEEIVEFKKTVEKAK